ncbi:unnamed protein product [Adineta steineri]|uniref:Uncharacterized protein n=1 Tax=Adineta steineri TaxID=433720 RepID=A0A819LF72_9BILA|nr:unnamed protein product [Adineta steineri]
MAATSYKTLSPGTYNDERHHGGYNLHIGPLTTHYTHNPEASSASNDIDAIQQQPKYYLRDKYDEQLAYNQSNDQTSTSSNHTDKRYGNLGTTNNIHLSYKTSMDRHQSNKQYQNTGVTLQRSPATYQSQSNRIRSDHQISNQPASDLRIPLANSGNNHESEMTMKRNDPSIEMKTNKSNEIRSTIIKQKEEIPEQKQNNGNQPSNKKTSFSLSKQNFSIDGKENDTNRSRQNMKQSQSVPNYHRSRQEDFETEDNTDSYDEYNDDVNTQHKSTKRTVLNDNTQKKNSSLPPVRRGQGPPFYEPTVTYPLSRGHPLWGRYLNNNRRSHSYEDDSDARCIDCEKRIPKSRTEKSEEEKEITSARKGINKEKNIEYEEDDTHYHDSYRSNEPKYYDEHVATHENSKKKHPSSIFESLYSQPSMGTDSYLENQRRRALRDAQGYYFPYKKYTLKDYKDLQKMGSHFNPYGPFNETKYDRTERARKRLEYASKIEKPFINTSTEEYKSPRDISPRKPFQFNHGQANDPARASKLERAREYAKVQLVRHRPTNKIKKKYNKPDPTEQYINSLFPEVDDDEDDDGKE